VVSFAQLDAFARSLPEVEVRPGHDGRPRWFVRGKCLGAHRDERPDALDHEGRRLEDVLVFCVEDEGAKAALLAERPDLYFTTAHFDNYPAVLTRISRLAAMGKSDMEELVTEAWLSRAPKRLVAQLTERGT
jgi:hypothetical protein